MSDLSQGARANLSGKQLEHEVESILEAQELDYRTQKPFQGVYAKTCKMDFYVDSPLRIAIECKAQNVAGSVDEKIPYVMLNLEAIDADVAILVMEGEHFDNKPQIMTWAKSYAHDRTTSKKLLKVFNLEQFKEWIIEQTKTGCAA